jgi:hypothetical protein
VLAREPVRRLTTELNQEDLEEKQGEHEVLSAFKRFVKNQTI